MADIATPGSTTLRSRLDKAWALVVLILFALLILDRPATLPTVTGALAALAHTAPFILFAVAVIGVLKATGSEALLAKAFQGRESRMIVLAALAGGLSPFCSCEVIPFIAALLAAGTPLSAVMAFWLASPLMDPAMFAITAGTLGTGFALAKTGAAIALGLGGGFVTRAFRTSPVFADPLRAAPARSCGSCCGGSARPVSDRPQWRFWADPARRRIFRDAALENLLFLGKWLTLAYLIEMLMLRYVPAESIAALAGGTGPGPILLASLVGAPAYLNGYAAVPLVSGLLEQGMSQGAAMAFVIAGGVSCIPAAIAVWALVKPRVFAAYLGFALTGAALAGFAWSAIAAA